MKNICQNCKEELQGIYCSNCGQPSATHRINAHFLWHDIQHGLLHFDKGIVYTIKELFIRPGHTIREFLQGKRVQHFKPISLVLVLAGIYGFLSHYFHINMLANNIEISGSGEKFNEIQDLISRLGNWIAEHYAIIALLQVPVFSIGTFISFRSAGYNFMEHFVINTFLAGQRLMLHIAAFPLYYIFNGTSMLRINARVIDSIGYFLTAWALFQLFNGVGNIRRVWKVILSLLITFFILFMVFVLTAKYFIAYGIK